MQYAEEKAGISKKVSRFTFPLCTTINMNACAAFILITVMYVIPSYGYISLNYIDMGLGMFSAVIAGVVNADVPMDVIF